MISSGELASPSAYAILDQNPRQVRRCPVFRSRERPCVASHLHDSSRNRDDLLRGARLSLGVRDLGSEPSPGETMPRIQVERETLRSFPPSRFFPESR